MGGGGGIQHQPPFHVDPVYHGGGASGPVIADGRNPVLKEQWNNMQRLDKDWNGMNVMSPPVGQIFHPNKVRYQF